MKIQRAIDVLLNHNKPTRKVIRDRLNFTKLMDLLGHPYKDFKSIHITGTNGKGSVSLKTAKILQLAGYKVGLYTSPHLFTFRERIQVNNQLCDPQHISDIIIRINDITVKNAIPISYFEILTAASFLYFRDNKCDFASIEVGVGGLKDTTNIITPLVSVLTSIGMDHMDLLGPTLDDIARDKSGIIKDGVPIVLGPTAQRPIVLEAAQNHHSPVYKVNEDKQFQSFDDKNNEISRQVVKALKNHYEIEIKDEDIKKGLLAKQPCRMETLDTQYLPKWAKDKRIYFDVGHNPDAIKQIIKMFDHNKKELVVIYGTSKGKDYANILQLYETIASSIYLVVAQHSRAATISDIQPSFISVSQNPSIYRAINDGNIQKTLLYATADPSTKVILICGSFFIMPEARGFFQPKVLQLKEENLNECYQLLN